MRNEFMLAINQVCAERQLAKEVVLEAVEAALITAYKRNFGSAANIKATIDPETGAAHVYAEKVVTEQVSDPKTEISLAEAKQVNSDANYDDVVLVETTPKDFGRIAAQTAKQVILQRIREAERDALYSVYAEREGEIVNGTVQSIDSQVVILNLGRAEGTLPRSEQIPGERYRLNQRLRAYVMEVEKSTRGPRIILSRNHRNMLRRLLELEVPEIFNGSVEIKAIAREPGSRSKVAVAALRPGVDPVGSCVGMRGTRIQGIVNELSGEKIDVVEWSSEITGFIANALSPAQVVSVHVDDGPDGKTATVVVPDRQLSLAIGKEGQNARLAAKLTGWRIDIKSASEAAAEAFAPPKPEPALDLEEDLLARAEAILAQRSSGEITDAEVQELPEALIDMVEELASAAEEAEAEESEEAEEVPEAEEIPEAEMEVLEADEAPAEEYEEAAEESVEPEEEYEPEAEESEEEYEEPEMEAASEDTAEGEAGDEVEELEDLEGYAEPEELAYVSVDELGDDEEDEDYDDESGTGKKKKGKAWRKKHQMVFDESAGRVVVKRKRKPSRRRDWELDE